ncbi:MAG: ATP-binding cassette domain-containing protein [Chloroflexi bacterium]|nr:ATP-binding cassette domain-containing protein [Chloroflexota bacterium]
MDDIAVQVEGIGKKYHIGKIQARYRTARETLTDAIQSPFRRAGKLLRGQATGAAELDEEIWALRDISFNIKHGEVVGIIGRNGAGKSTLLKIFSRITEPSEGRARIRGRVGSLLEVGTGFHPELTGRENVFLNGAILGMKKTEIEQKFDEIVDFAEVEKFIDTPVKHYSSGMQVRLAFAVAAHLEPEILIVDEVLAVGDAQFQKKCLNKMEDVGQQGRTVLFVSHNMSTITRLCDRTILLDDGRVVEDGPSYQVVSTYLTSGLGTTAAREWTNSRRQPGADVARLCAVRVQTKDEQISGAFDIREPVLVEMEYEVIESGYVLLPNFHFYNEGGVEIFPAIDLDPEWRQRPRPVGRYTSTAVIPGNLLAEGTFFVRSALITLEPVKIQFNEPDAVAFQVIDSHDGNSARGDYVGSLSGAVRPIFQWRTEYVPTLSKNGTQKV